VLRYKVKSTGSKVLEKSSEEVVKPKLHDNDLAMLEDELKPECDILNNLVKVINSAKGNLEKLSNENRRMAETMEKLKLELNGKLRCEVQRTQLISINRQK
jgi:hypothetical protein